MTTPTPSTDSLKNDIAVLQAVMSANKALIGLERADFQQLLGYVYKTMPPLQRAIRRLEADVAKAGKGKGQK